jgi:hypothetical protein
MSANTEDLIVKRCWFAEEDYVHARGVVCQIEWHGQTETMPLESILNEINKTSVFAHGTAVAAQRMKEKR